MLFLGVVCKIRLKYSNELLDYKVKNTNTYVINNKSFPPVQGEGAILLG